MFASNKGPTLDSAFGFNNCAADILQDVYQGIEQYKKESRVTAWGIAASRAWLSASPSEILEAGAANYRHNKTSERILRTFSHTCRRAQSHDHTPDTVSRHHIATKYKLCDNHDVGRLPPPRKPYRLCGMCPSLELSTRTKSLMRCAGLQGDLAARHHWQPPCRSSEGRAGPRQVWKDR